MKTFCVDTKVTGCGGWAMGCLGFPGLVGGGQFLPGGFHAPDLSTVLRDGSV